MKIVITAQGTEMSDQVDPRFGRAKWFILFDTESGEHFALDNEQNLNAMQGAGIQAARNVQETGAEAVLTGTVGPKAFMTLEAAGVKVCTGVSGTVAEAVEKFKAGELTTAKGANVEGHSS